MGQTGRAWDLILPAQRSLLSRESYIECQDGSPFDVVGVEIVDKYEERFPAAGLGEQDSVAMTARVTVSAVGEEFTETDTFHAYGEGGRWYVSLSDETFACAQA